MSRAKARSAAQAVAWMDDQTGMPNRSRSSGTRFSVGNWEQAMNSERLRSVTVARAFSRTWSSVISPKAATVSQKKLSSTSTATPA